MTAAALSPTATPNGSEHGTPAELVGELLSRNVDIIAPREQAALLAMRILIAGCGTVGGSIVEPLTRLGVCDFVLADPDRFELSNLNRQAARLADVGRLKTEVLAESVVAINPFAAVEELPGGVTPENVAAALHGATCAFDGIDVFMSPWAKYCLHREAARRRVPVVVGADYGGKPTVYVFDYRRDPRPFYGRATEAAHRDGRIVDALAWIGPFSLPADFAPVVVDRVATANPWPQVVYCSLGLAALATRAIVDLASGRRVPHRIAVDIHMRTRTRTARLRQWLAWPRATLRTGAALRRARREGFGFAPRPAPDPVVPEALLRRLESSGVPGGAVAPAPSSTDQAGSRTS
jgi:molybdopterin/thiamine biosynthesis adenylyltransferase